MVNFPEIIKKVEIMKMREYLESEPISFAYVLYGWEQGARKVVDFTVFHHFITSGTKIA